MKYLILLSAVIYTVSSNHLENGAYSYEYHTNDGSRHEVRHPNGQITGGYKYLENSKLHEVKYASEPNKEITVISHNSFGTIPDDVYSKTTYRRNSNVANEGVQFDELPPVYVRHVPSPVKHEPIVPIIDVESPLQRNHYHSVEAEDSAPARRTFEVKTVPEVTYHVAPTPTFVKTPEYILPEYILSHPVQHQVIIHQETPSIPDVIHHEEVIVDAPIRQLYHHEENSIPPVKFVDGHGSIPLLGADVPLTEDGLTYEVALAKKQHLAAVAAVKATLPELH